MIRFGPSNLSHNMAVVNSQKPNVVESDIQHEEDKLKF